MHPSGFPEWLPEGQLVERRVIDTLRQVFELYGFGPLRTRAVESVKDLVAKGETDKEIYVLRRLQADHEDDDAGVGLRFDLTVPLARYVSENAGRLLFPFRRYQIQPVWRGERPQEGRYREFIQADIDIVGRGHLPAGSEAELPAVVADALRRLPLPGVVVRMNNRKILQGFLAALGVTDVVKILRIIDKLDKVGPQALTEMLVDNGVADREAQLCLRLAQIRRGDASFVDDVRALGVSDPTLDEGLEELAAVLQAGQALQPGLLQADLGIARGLDYYTGTVYETVLTGYDKLGSVCSGGRYDNLIGAGTDSYPGVGISVGVTRILGALLGRNKLGASRKVPSCVLVAVIDEETRRASSQVAAQLRARGIPTEVSPGADKYGKQIRYADQRGIPFVWFTQPDGHQVRDLRSDTQHPVDPADWNPPASDLTVQILSLP